MRGCRRRRSVRILATAPGRHACGSCPTEPSVYHGRPCCSSTCPGMDSRFWPQKALSVILGFPKKFQKRQLQKASKGPQTALSEKSGHLSDIFTSKLTASWTALLRCFTYCGSGPGRTHISSKIDCQNRKALPAPRP